MKKLFIEGLHTAAARCHRLNLAAASLVVVVVYSALQLLVLLETNGAKVRHRSLKSIKQYSRQSIFAFPAAAAAFCADVQAQSLCRVLLRLLAG